MPIRKAFDFQTGKQKKHAVLLEKLLPYHLHLVWTTEEGEYGQIMALPSHQLNIMGLQCSLTISNTLLTTKRIDTHFHTFQLPLFLI